MPIFSNLSSLSLAYRSSVGRRQPPFSGVFSVPKYAFLINPPPPPSPPTASVVSPRHMHSHQPQRARINWEIRAERELKFMEDIRMLNTGHSADVALSMAKRLLQDEGKNSNVVFSPMSIHVLLSLIAAGSSGPTLDQLLCFLKSDSIAELNHFASRMAFTVLADGSHYGGPRLSFATGVWVDQSLSLKNSFKQLLDTTYKAALHQCDFNTKADEVVSEANSWVDRHTKGLITNILFPGSIDSLTYLILANAIYFKGVWANEFDPSRTKEEEFYLVDGGSVKVPFMTSNDRQYIAAYDGFKVLRMAYRQGYDPRSFSMYIFLPDAKDGLPSLINKLDTQPGFIDRHIPCKQLMVGEFKVPKFKISFDFEVSTMLKKLGLVLPFVGGGDLLGMVDDSSQIIEAFVSNIFHKSLIEVNEKGTEAAAASLLSLGGCCRMTNSDIIDFIADHPFLFVIREDVTRALCFVGQVHNPIAKTT